MKIIKNRLQTLIEEQEKTTLSTFKPTLDFFKHIGIGRKRFHQLIRNEVSPTFSEMHALADYFGVKIWELHDTTLHLISPKD